MKGDATEKKVLMIMGAQRSGTTLLSRIFDDFYYADVFGEFSELSSMDKYRMRLNPASEINKSLSKSAARLIVMKPLVESQNAISLLREIPSSTVIWLYRDYLDVASSNVRKFGIEAGGLNHVRAFADKEFANEDFAVWKSENASPNTMDIMCSNYRKNISPHEAAALFWYARNILFYEQHLEQLDNVVLLKYEAFVKHPFLTIAYILNQVSISEIRSKTLSNIDNKPVGKGRGVPISSDISHICGTLGDRLDDTFYSSPLGSLLSRLDRKDSC